MHAQHLHKVTDTVQASLDRNLLCENRFKKLAQPFKWGKTSILMRHISLNIFFILKFNYLPFFWYISLFSFFIHINNCLHTFDITSTWIFHIGFMLYCFEFSCCRFTHSRFNLVYKSFFILLQEVWSLRGRVFFISWDFPAGTREFSLFDLQF